MKKKKKRFLTIFEHLRSLHIKASLNTFLFSVRVKLADFYSAGSSVRPGVALDV